MSHKLHRIYIGFKFRIKFSDSARPRHIPLSFSYNRFIYVFMRPATSQMRINFLMMPISNMSHITLHTPPLALCRIYSKMPHRKSCAPCRKCDLNKLKLSIIYAPSPANWRGMCPHVCRSVFVTSSNAYLSESTFDDKRRVQKKNGWRKNAWRHTNKNIRNISGDVWHRFGRHIMLNCERDWYIDVWIWQISNYLYFK